MKYLVTHKFSRISEFSAAEVVVGIYEAHFAFEARKKAQNELLGQASADMMMPKIPRLYRLEHFKAYALLDSL